MATTQVSQHFKVAARQASSEGIEVYYEARFHCYFGLDVATGWCIDGSTCKVSLYRDRSGSLQGYRCTSGCSVAPTVRRAILWLIILKPLYNHMTLPSFQVPWSPSETGRPRIYILEVRDRNKAERPLIATILVEREETVERDRDGVLSQAKVRIHFRRLRGERNQGDRMPAFSGSYQAVCPDGPLVSLTGSITGGAVFLDLPGLEGQHIGTYLINEIVGWAMQWPDASVRPISLVDGQAGDANRERRNRFYEQFGIEFDYIDAQRRVGQSRHMPVAELTTTQAWAENITVIPMDDFLQRLLRDNTRLASDLTFRTRALVEMRDEVRRAERWPLWWALRQLLWKVRSII